MFPTIMVPTPGCKILTLILQSRSISTRSGWSGTLISIREASKSSAEVKRGGSVSKKKDSKRQFWEKYRRDKLAKKRRLAFQTPPPTNKKDDVGKKVAVAVVGEKNNKELKDYENIVVEI